MYGHAHFCTLLHHILLCLLDGKLPLPDGPIPSDKAHAVLVTLERKFFMYAAMPPTNRVYVLVTNSIRHVYFLLLTL